MTRPYPVDPDGIRARFMALQPGQSALIEVKEGLTVSAMQTFLTPYIKRAGLTGLITLSTIAGVDLKTHKAVFIVRATRLAPKEQS